MSTEPIEALAKFDAYLERLKAHDWTYEATEDARVWRKGQAAQKQLQTDMKEDQTPGQPLMRAYWAFMNWTYDHHDTLLRDQLVQKICNELAVLATTQLIQPVENQA